MIPVALDELRALDLGHLEGDGEVTGLQVDSRRVGPGDLFVAVGRVAEVVAAATLVPHDAHHALATIAGLANGTS